MCTQEKACNMTSGLTLWWRTLPHKIQPFIFTGQAPFVHFHLLWSHLQVIVGFLWLQNSNLMLLLQADFTLTVSRRCHSWVGVLRIHLSHVCIIIPGMYKYKIAMINFPGQLRLGSHTSKKHILGIRSWGLDVSWWIHHVPSALIILAMNWHILQCSRFLSTFLWCLFVNFATWIRLTLCHETH